MKMFVDLLDTRQKYCLIDKGRDLKYSFGHNKDVATMEVENEYIEVVAGINYGDIIIPFLGKYKRDLRLVGFKDDNVIIRIYDTSAKDNLMGDFIEAVKIPCKVKISLFIDGEYGVKIKFKDTPYKKCLNKLKRLGLEHNKKKNKWWITVDNNEFIESLIETLNEFKYLRVTVEDNR